MIKSFEFYFDFASPYTLLAHKEIQRIELEFVSNDTKNKINLCL